MPTLSWGYFLKYSQQGGATAPVSTEATRGAL